MQTVFPVPRRTLCVLMCCRYTVFQCSLAVGIASSLKPSGYSQQLQASCSTLSSSKPGHTTPQNKNFGGQFLNGPTNAVLAAWNYLQVYFANV